MSFILWSRATVAIAYTTAESFLTAAELLPTTAKDCGLNNLWGGHLARLSGQDAHPTKFLVPKLQLGIALKSSSFL
ncbi:MAG: hypothetical protein HC879_06005 [Leptolyngbyaceae cyanobacterium SL_5_9]|nr:hypothetical protein [Leptolyngbyaceae cyanobacterium SL_5_9]